MLTDNIVFIVTLLEKQNYCHRPRKTTTCLVIALNKLFGHTQSVSTYNTSVGDARPAYYAKLFL